MQTHTQIFESLPVLQISTWRCLHLGNIPAFCPSPSLNNPSSEFFDGCLCLSVSHTEDFSQMSHL